jgi:hypothetical protein
LGLFGKSRADKEREARQAAFADQALALRLSWVGQDDTLRDTLGASSLVQPPPARLGNVMEGLRGTRLVTVFDQEWAPARRDPAFNPGHGIDDSEGTCALTLVSIKTVSGACPARPPFVLVPNLAAQLRGQFTGRLQGEGGLGELLAAGAQWLMAQYAGSGIGFPERPHFDEVYLLRGNDPRTLRGFFTPARLDHFLQRPGWIVESLEDRLLVSVTLDSWPPTRRPLTEKRSGADMPLPPEHLPALVEGALAIADCLERA